MKANDGFEERTWLATEYAAWVLRPTLSPVRAWRWYRRVDRLARETGLPRREVLRGVVEDAVVMLDDYALDDGSWSVAPTGSRREDLA
ncbi:MAG: hypothetical protein L6Q99_21210 [Planctomycetes bacterium]|nr:hypothetical protein [Planctomycetota bacterium]